MAVRAGRRLVVEALEGRVVLSRAAGLSLGALGDSYTAEYATHPTGAAGARNWVEILSAAHRASFGSSQLQANVSLSNVDFPYDKAEMGATTSDVLLKELPELEPAVASGSVTHVCVFVGINDFSSVVTDFAHHPDTPEQELSNQVDQVQATAESNLDRIVMRLFQINPGVKLVVATIPVVTSLPFDVEALDLLGGQALGVALSGAVEAYNQHIRMLASVYPSVALADVGATFESRVWPSGPVSVASSTMGGGLNDVFQGDGTHPNTIPQGWIANDFLSALRSKFGVRTSTIPDSQIYQIASLAKWRQNHGMAMR